MAMALAPAKLKALPLRGGRILPFYYAGKHSSRGRYAAVANRLRPGAGDWRGCRAAPTIIASPAGQPEVRYLKLRLVSARARDFNALACLT